MVSVRISKPKDEASKSIQERSKKDRNLDRKFNSAAGSQIVKPGVANGNIHKYL